MSIKITGTVTEVVQQYFDAARENGATPVLMQSQSDAYPDLLVMKGKKGKFLVRVNPDPNSTTEGFPRTPEQEEFDSWFKAPIYNLDDPADLVALINAVPPDTEPVPEIPPTPPAPTDTIIRVWGSPQFNRVKKADGVPNQDRNQIIQVSGRSMLSYRFLAKPGDLNSGGNRSEMGGTWNYAVGTQNWDLYKKTLTGLDGDRTRCRWKTRFDSTLFPTVGVATDVWGLFAQWHQAAGTSPTGGSGSPPIEMNVHKHPTTGLYWLRFRCMSSFFDDGGQPATIGATGNGVLWTALLQFDHDYQFELEVFHKRQPGNPAAPVPPYLGWVKLKVDGVQVVAQTPQVTMYDEYNHFSLNVYQKSTITVARAIDHWDARQDVIPGPNNALYTIYTPP